MVYVQTDGSIPEQVPTWKAALARQPDALITSIIDNDAFDDVIQRARDAGIIVISSNVDDLEGAAGNARQAFVGQGFIPAGYGLARAQSATSSRRRPDPCARRVSGPGQNWFRAAGAGITNFLDDYIAANPEREITYERIDSGLDLAVVADRVGAYLAANPNTTAYFDTGFWHAGVAGVLRDRGIPAGQVLLGGSTLCRSCWTKWKSGYIQVQVDQQPYMQGFMPVMMVYQTVNVGLAPVDINTGEALVYPDMVPAIRELSEQGLR